MEVELEKAKRFMDATVKIGDLGTKIKDGVQSPEEVFGFLSLAGSALSVLGVILGSYQTALDKKSRAIFAKFHTLEQKLKTISNDVKDLEKIMNWVGEEIIGYYEVVRLIDFGMEYLQCATDTRKLPKVGQKQTRKRPKVSQEQTYIDRMDQLVELSNDQGMILTVDMLKMVLSGTGELEEETLYSIYCRTGGDRRKLAIMAARLVQLMISGMILVVVIKNYVEGTDEGERAAKRYHLEIGEVRESLTNLFRKCAQNFKSYLQNDLRTELLTDSNPQDSVGILINLLKLKYNYLELVVIIRDDCFERVPDIGRNCIYQLSVNGKCGFVFYANKRLGTQDAEQTLKKTADGFCKDFAQYFSGYNEEGCVVSNVVSVSVVEKTDCKLIHVYNWNVYMYSRIRPDNVLVSTLYVCRQS